MKLLVVARQWHRQWHRQWPQAGRNACLSLQRLTQFPQRSAELHLSDAAHRRRSIGPDGALEGGPQFPIRTENAVAACQDQAARSIAAEWLDHRSSRLTPLLSYARNWAPESAHDFLQSALVSLPAQMTLAETRWAISAIS